MQQDFFGQYLKKKKSHPKPKMIAEYHKLTAKKKKRKRKKRKGKGKKSKSLTQS